VIQKESSALFSNEVNILSISDLIFEVLWRANIELSTLAEVNGVDVTESDFVFESKDVK
jgi:hypothetical protein